MIAKDLINYMIPPLKPKDSVVMAQQWMDELRLSELPVVEDGKFLGLIDEELLFNDALKYPHVGDYPLVGNQCFVRTGVHYYEALKTSNEFGFRLVAVLDDLDQFIGVISAMDIVDTFAKNASVTSPGAILALRLKLKDYSLSEISRIIESNQAKVLSSYLCPHSIDPSELLLTLKLNTEEVTHIKMSLENNGFFIEDSFNEQNTNNQEKERLDILLKYLKI